MASAAAYRLRAAGQGLHELAVKRRGLGAEHLIGLAVRAEQRRDRRRHLIGACGRDSGRLGRRGRVGRANHRTEAREIPRRSRHELRIRDHERHLAPPQ
ncbi:hypothetical protein MRGA327_09200 [Mycobacterium tuberculosis RGTB327]|nr:hypothetical protein MRGA327_09200 [Mycobacterium tuberculosis RGTB327]